MKILIYISVFLMMSFASIFAQDIHFSQYKEAAQFINPALTGRFPADHRVVLNYRSQWSSVAEPYRTMGFQYDANIKLNRRAKDAIGLGLSFYDDKAGAGDMGIGQIAFAVSYTKTMDSKNFFTFGMQASYIYNHLDIEKLTWDSQYDGSHFDASLPANESGYAETFSYFDFNTGINWEFIANKTTSYYAGVALLHLKRNELKFKLNSDEILHKRYTVIAGFSKKINSTVTVKPSVYYQHQGPANEVIFGSQFKYKVDESVRNKSMLDMYFTLGAYYRYGDAFIFSAGYSYMNFTVRLSYDINSSSLAIVSKNKGGFEISLIYMTPYKRAYRGSSLL